MNTLPSKIQEFAGRTVGHCYTSKKNRQRFDVRLIAFTNNPNLVIIEDNRHTQRYINPKRLRKNLVRTLEAKICDRKVDVSKLFWTEGTATARF